MVFRVVVHLHDVDIIDRSIMISEGKGNSYFQGYLENSFLTIIIESIAVLSQSIL